MIVKVLKECVMKVLSYCDGWTVDVVVEFFKGLLGDSK